MWLYIQTPMEIEMLIDAAMEDVAQVLYDHRSAYRTFFFFISVLPFFFLILHPSRYLRIHD